MFTKGLQFATSRYCRKYGLTITTALYNMEFIRNKCRNVKSTKFTVANYQNSPLYSTAFDAHIIVTQHETN